MQGRRREEESVQEPRLVAEVLGTRATSLGYSVALCLVSTSYVDSTPCRNTPRIEGNFSPPPSLSKPRPSLSPDTRKVKRRDGPYDRSSDSVCWVRFFALIGRRSVEDLRDTRRQRAKRSSSGWDMLWMGLACGQSAGYYLPGVGYQKVFLGFFALCGFIYDMRCTRHSKRRARKIAAPIYGLQHQATDANTRHSGGHRNPSSPPDPTQRGS